MQRRTAGLSVTSPNRSSQQVKSSSGFPFLRRRCRLQLMLRGRIDPRDPRTAVRAHINNYRTEPKRHLPIRHHQAGPRQDVTHKIAAERNHQSHESDIRVHKRVLRRSRGRRVETGAYSPARGTRLQDDGYLRRWLASLVLRPGVCDPRGQALRSYTCRTRRICQAQVSCFQLYDLEHN